MSKIKFASIITTYRCNAKCHMCNIWKHPSAAGDEVTPAVLEKLPHIGMINVTGGEPFLRDDIEEIFDVLVGRTGRIVVSTNGYMTERIVEVARKYPHLGFRVSLEGLPAANDELRGLPDGFDRGLRTLASLAQLGVEDIGFAITLSDRNANDLMELYSVARMMKVEFATAAVHNSYYFHKFDNVIQDRENMIRELDKLIDELLCSSKVKDWFRAYFNYGLQQFVAGKPRLLPCNMGHDAFFLDPLGEVRPCNVMEETMGNLKDKTFAEIWEGKEAEGIRGKVKSCGLNCWMMGSVAEPMKDHIAIPAAWIIKKKLQAGRLGRFFGGVTK